MATAEFNGKDFLIAERVGTMPLMRFAKFAQSGIEADSMEGLAATYEMIEQCLDPEDWSAFERHATTTRADEEELMEFVAKVMTIVSEGRPTGRSSDSSDGPQTIELSSEVDSSSSGAEAVIHRFNEKGRPDLALIVRKRQESLTA